MMRRNALRGSAMMMRNERVKWGCEWRLKMVIWIIVLGMAFEGSEVRLDGRIGRGLDECVITTDCAACRTNETVRLSGSAVTALPSGAGSYSGYFSTSW